MKKCLFYCVFFSRKQNYSLFFILYSLFMLVGCTSDESTENTKYVNPFIGTDETHFISQWRSEGGTYPGAVAPHGMVQISPETSGDGEYLQGYYYSQDTIRKFGLTDHFSGWPNGSVGKGQIMPFTTESDNSEISLNNIKSHFSHDNEIAVPGYYSVLLDESRINCHFSTLSRSAIGKFEYKKEGKNGLLIRGYKKMEKLSDTELLLTIVAGRSEYAQKVKQYLYIYLTFDAPFELKENKKSYSLFFDEKLKNNELTFKCGISYTSATNAKLNLDTEIAHWNLEQVKKEANTLWNKELSRIEIEGDEKDKTIFYTGLYHASLLPINVTDVNRQFPGYEKNEPLQDDEKHYIYYTPWDAFRTTHPLVNLINPKKSRDYLRSMIRIYKSYEFLPEPKVMTGIHLTSLYADALAKDIKDFDIELAYKGLRELLADKPYFRKELIPYDTLGYVPYPHHYATTATLEFAYNDWALAQIAKYLGKQTEYEELLQRSFNYRNNYHPEKRFMCTKNADGTWSPASIYAEADEWNMSWFVPHNMQDLINLMGGEEAFCEHLNRNFEEGHFVLDNECPVNYPFLFSYAGQPWQTMKWANHSLREYFNTTPGGIPGNDDWGSISAWYLWSSLGIFPACPGTDELIIASPIFDKVTINYENGKKLIIETNNASKENIYVKNLYLNEKAYNKPYISQSDLLESGYIRFEMSNQPNKEWGTGKDALPFSVTQTQPDFSVLALTSTNKKTVKSNEEFILTAKIKNSGSKGSYQLKLKNSETEIYNKWILFNENETKEIEVPVKLYKGGKQEVSLENLSVEVNIEPLKSDPKNSLTYSVPEVKALIKKGNDIEFNCSVKNISGFDVEFEPVVFINNKEVKKLNKIILQPGESTQIKDVLSNQDNTGLTKLKINNSPEAIFKIYEKATETMVLHYTFDKDKGKIIDNSGFENHGEVIGKISYVAGVSGKGIKFDDGYIRIPETQSMSITDENITMLCWYKPENEKGKASLITKGGHNMLKLNGKWQLKLAVGGWGKGQCFYNAKTKPDNNKQPAWMGEWSHFGGIGTANSIQVSYNGEIKNQIKHKGKIGHTDFEWRIGSNSELPANKKPDGTIDEVMIFAGALTEDEIKQIYSMKNK